jgi:hypothetical protein
MLLTMVELLASLQAQAVFRVGWWLESEGWVGGGMGGWVGGE